MRMESNDENLAQAAANGDADSFAALIARYYDRLFGLAFRLTGHRAEAEDLTQDICANLPAKLLGFRGEARFSTWFYRIVVNAAHDRRRRQASYARATQGWGDWEIGNRADAAQSGEMSDWLHRAMAALKEDLRDTLALILDDVTHAEAAEILGVSEGTISWRMSRVKQQLAQMRATEDQI